MLPYPASDHPPLDLTEQYRATKYIVSRALRVQGWNQKGKEKSQIPEAMEEIEERETSTEQA